MVIPASDITYLVNMAFSFANINKIIAKYNMELREIFNLQGELVLYPQGQVTAFKYKNLSYINPDFPDLIKNNTVVNERPLHPTLVKRLTDVEEDYNQIGMNKRRMEAYFKRAGTYFATDVYPLLITEILREHLTITAYYFVYMTLPDGFNRNESAKEYFSNTFYTLEKGLVNLTVNDFKNILNNAVSKFQQKENTTIQQFKQFIFKTTMLGF